MLNEKELKTLTLLIKEEIAITKNLIEASPEDTDELNAHIEVLASIASKLNISL